MAEENSPLNSENEIQLVNLDSEFIDSELSEFIFLRQLEPSAGEHLASELDQNSATEKQFDQLDDLVVKKWKFGEDVLKRLIGMYLLQLYEL